MDQTPLESITSGQKTAAALMVAMVLTSGLAWVAALFKTLARQPVIPPAPAERRTWSAGLSFSVLAIVIPLQVFSLMAIGGVFKDPSAPQPELSVWLVQLSCGLSLVQMLVLWGLPHAFAPVKQTDFGLVCAPEDLACGTWGFALSWLPVCAVNVVVMLLNWRAPDGKHDFFQLLDKDSSLATIGWIAVSVIIVAPLAEEQLYRVLLQGWFEQYLPPAVAIGLSSVLFAAVHYRPGRPDALPLLPLALLLGYVYHRRRSLPAVALMHGLFNATMLTLALLQGH